jgi:predicted membrane metal-binding protein
VPALMRSELPEIARTRHHWIVLVRPPSLWAGIAVLLLLVWALVAPAMFVVLALLLGAVAFLRWQTWRAEVIILTKRRIVRVRGVPETTTTEASLRIDRVSGARLIQTVPGKLLGYGTVELEAPGDHPDVRKLVKIAEPHRFYGLVRAIVFADRAHPDPDDVPSGYVTERLPRLPE